MPRFGWWLSTALLVVLLITAGAMAQRGGPSFEGFDDFVKRYRASAPGARAELTRAFIDWRLARGGFPIVDSKGGVVFLYVGQGIEKNVGVVGDFRRRSYNSVYWDRSGEPMTRIASDGPVFFSRMKFEPDARLDYQMAVDDKYAVDALNGRKLVSGAAPSSGTDGEMASELVMPDYRPPRAIAARDGAAHGRLSVVDEAWATPRVTIYLPPGYGAAKDYAVVYTADGKQWRDYIGLPAILDNLIADGVIQPVIVVMIDSAPDRGDWYLFNPAYLDYLARVVDYVDHHYPTRKRSEQRLHMGASAGGRASLQVGFERPGLISNLALLSPSLTAPPQYYEPFFSGAKQPDRRLKIWISAGTYEGYIYKDAKLMERYLGKAGLGVRAVYTHEGHSFGAWRDLAPEVLAHFFPAGGTKLDARSNSQNTATAP